MSSPIADGVVSSTMDHRIASRFKYLVDTPDIIQGYLDKSLFLKSAIRFIQSNCVYSSLRTNENYGDAVLDNLWNHIVDCFPVEISNRSRKSFLSLDLSVHSYADALAAIMCIDRIPVLDLFFNSRTCCISQKKAACLVDHLSHVITVFCDIANIAKLTIAHVGQLFLPLSSRKLPLLKQTLLTSLDSPLSRLFTEIPNPDFEIASWLSCARSIIVLFDQTKRFCLEWFYDCFHCMLSSSVSVDGEISGKYLMNVLENVQQIKFAEEKIRSSLQDDHVLNESLKWLKSVSASKVISPWKTTSELVLGHHLDIWMEFFEHSFRGRMQFIIESKFDDLFESLNVKEWIDDIAKWIDDGTDYPGDEASHISSLVHTLFEDVLEDLLIFFDSSPNASLRRDDLAPFFQSHCFRIMYTILFQLGFEMEQLYYDESMQISKLFVIPRDVAVLRLLSIQRLLFAIQKHPERIAMILGSPKLWVTKAMAHIPSNYSVYSPNSGRAGHVGGSLNEQLDSSEASDSLEVLNRKTKDIFSEAHDLWMFGVSEKLSTDLHHNLMQDDKLSTTTPPSGWEEIVVKHEQFAESTSETNISLPTTPSKYITYFLNQACTEICRAGGHVLEKLTLQSFASKLLEKVIGIYEDFLSNGEAFDNKVSKEGVLQIIFDLGFSADIFSGGDITRQDVDVYLRINGLVKGLAQRFDEMDWLMYEPYLWENERQWYLHHAADFKFLTQPGCRMSQTLSQTDVARFKHGMALI